jgi:hypothetical protein
MNDPASEQLQRRLNRIGWIGALVLVVAVVLAITLGRSIGVDARQRVRDEIAHVNAGEKDQIYVSNRVEMAEFLSARSQLDEAHPFDLSIQYTSDVDDFLQRIADQRGLRRLVLHSTDVSGAGIESIAQLPDLEKLTINEIREGAGSPAGWLRYLAAQTLVSTLEPLAEAPKLKELVLYTSDVPASEIKQLRERLTSCTITLPRDERQRRDERRHP